MPVRDALCAVAGEFGLRGVQTAVRRGTGGRHDPDAQKGDPDAPRPQRFLPHGRGGRIARRRRRRIVGPDRPADARNGGFSKATSTKGNWRSDRSPRSSKTCRRPARSSAVSSPNTKPPAGASARSDPSRNTESPTPPGCGRRPVAAPSSCRRHRKAPGPGAKVSCSRSCGGRNPASSSTARCPRRPERPSRCRRRHRRSCSPAACGIRRRTDG